MKKRRYEAILTLKGYPTLVSVNQFLSLTNLCRWLDEVNLAIVDVEVVLVNSGRTIDPLELLRIWRG